MDQAYSYEDVKEMAEKLLSQTKHRPIIGVVCGSGLGNLADNLKDTTSVEYKNIPKFPVSQVAGHKNRLVFGLLNGVPTVCMQGRIHSYEGYSLATSAMPIRLMKLLGVRAVVITNAAGGVNPDYKPGDIMIIKDHINFPGLMGANALTGHNDERWGPRFPAMAFAYDRKLYDICKKTAVSLGLLDMIKEGVYGMTAGPTYETVAETRMLRLLGVDTVGMSTVHEVVTAHHCGLRVLGISLVTNPCQSRYESTNVANHEEVLESAKNSTGNMIKLVSTVVPEIAKVL